MSKKREKGDSESFVEYYLKIFDFNGDLTEEMDERDIWISDDEVDFNGGLAQGMEKREAAQISDDTELREALFASNNANTRARKKEKAVRRRGLRVPVRKIPSSENKKFSSSVRFAGSKNGLKHSGRKRLDLSVYSVANSTMNPEYRTDILSKIPTGIFKKDKESSELEYAKNYLFSIDTELIRAIDDAEAKGVKGFHVQHRRFTNSDLRTSVWPYLELGLNTPMQVPAKLPKRNKYILDKTDITKSRYSKVIDFDRVKIIYPKINPQEVESLGQKALVRLAFHKGGHAMHFALKYGNIEYAYLLLRSLASKPFEVTEEKLNRENIYHNTALDEAVETMILIDKLIDYYLKCLACSKINNSAELYDHCVIKGEKFNHGNLGVTTEGNKYRMIEIFKILRQSVDLKEAYITIIKELVEIGATAKRYSNSQYLVDIEGLQENKNKALERAVEIGDINKVLWLINIGADRTFEVDQFIAEQLIEAAYFGEIDKVQKILDHGEHPDLMSSEYDGTALHYAIIDGHDGVVSLLLARGANQGITTSDGKTALIMAADYRQASTLAILLEDYMAKGREMVDIDHRDSDGLTALIKACTIGNNGEEIDIEVVKLLLLYKADLNVFVPEKTYSAFINLCVAGHIEGVSYIIDKGFDYNPEVEIKGGMANIAEIAYLEAKSKGHENIIKKLEEVGVYPDENLLLDEPSIEDVISNIAEFFTMAEAGEKIENGIGGNSSI